MEADSADPVQTASNEQLAMLYLTVCLQVVLTLQLEINLLKVRDRALFVRLYGEIIPEL